MSAKQLHFRSEARQNILQGANQLADAVRVTLGPKSKCVLIEKKFGHPIVCDDVSRSPRNLSSRILRKTWEFR